MLPTPFLEVELETLKYLQLIARTTSPSDIHLQVFEYYYLLIKRHHHVFYSRFFSKKISLNTVEPRIDM